MHLPNLNSVISEVVVYYKWEIVPPRVEPEHFPVIIQELFLTGYSAATK